MKHAIVAPLGFGLMLLLIGCQSGSPVGPTDQSSSTTSEGTPPLQKQDWSCTITEIYTPPLGLGTIHVVWTKYSGADRYKTSFARITSEGVTDYTHEAPPWEKSVRSVYMGEGHIVPGYYYTVTVEAYNGKWVLLSSVTSPCYFYQP